MMRYTYRGDKLTDPALKGMQCDPVKNARDKCITSTLATMLVIDALGVKYVVLRRQLRINRNPE